MLHIVLYKTNSRLWESVSGVTTLKKLQTGTGAVAQGLRALADLTEDPCCTTQGDLYVSVHVETKHLCFSPVYGRPADGNFAVHFPSPKGVLGLDVHMVPRDFMCSEASISSPSSLAARVLPFAPFCSVFLFFFQSFLYLCCFKTKSYFLVRAGLILVGILWFQPGECWMADMHQTPQDLSAASVRASHSGASHWDTIRTLLSSTNSSQARAQ